MFTRIPLSLLLASALGGLLGSAHAQQAVLTAPPTPSLRTEVMTFSCKPSVHGVGVGRCQGEIAAWVLDLPRPVSYASVKCEVWVRYIQENRSQVQRLQLEASLPKEPTQLPSLTLPFELSLSSAVRPVTRPELLRHLCSASWTWAKP